MLDMQMSAPPPLPAAPPLASQPLAWMWFRAYDLPLLLAVAPLLTDGLPETDPAVAATAAATAGTAAAADPQQQQQQQQQQAAVVLLRRHVASVLLPLLVGDLGGEADRVAELLGEQVGRLVCVCMCVFCLVLFGLGWWSAPLPVVCVCVHCVIKGR